MESFSKKLCPRRNITLLPKDIKLAFSKFAWAACQKASKGFKGANFDSFDAKKLAMEWFASIANNEELNEKMAGGRNETGEMSEGKTKHCINTCKINGEDEKEGKMIECCLCKRWYHTECVTSEKVEQKDVKTSNKKEQDESKTSITVVEETVLLEEDEKTKDGGAMVKTMMETMGEKPTKQTSGYASRALTVPQKVLELTKKISSFQALLSK